MSDALSQWLWALTRVAQKNCIAIDGESCCTVNEDLCLYDTSKAIWHKVGVMFAPVLLVLMLVFEQLTHLLQQHTLNSKLVGGFLDLMVAPSLSFWGKGATYTHPMWLISCACAFAPRHLLSHLPLHNR